MFSRKLIAVKSGRRVCFIPREKEEEEEEEEEEDEENKSAELRGRGWPYIEKRGEARRAEKRGTGCLVAW